MNIRRRWESGTYQRGIFNARNLEEAITGIAVVIFIGAVAFILVQLNGCAAREQGSLPAYCYNEELYTAALLRCVDKAETLAESKQCREAVDNSCGIVQTVTVRK